MSAPPDAPLPVEVEDLIHRFGERVALDGVSFTVEPGERFALLGPNGGGKTTLFRVLTSLLRPSSGRVRVFDHDVVLEPDAARDRLGVVFQEPALDPKLTVWENLLHHGHLHGLRGGALEERIGAGLEAARLTARVDDLAEALSGGMRRRVELVKVLLGDPGLLVLDEPTTGLDPGARSDFWSWIEEVRGERAMTVLVTTHLMEEAEAADRVLLLDRGRVVALDRPRALVDELSREVLTLEGPDLDALEAALQDDLQVPSVRVGDALRIETDDGKTRIQAILSALGPRIHRVTLGRPGLADVFLARTGHSFRERDRNGGPA